MPEPLLYISRKKALLFAGFFVLYEFLTYIANDMIMPGMLQVVESFHAPESMVATSLTAYILGGASLQLILGPLSDAWGRRPVMLMGALSFLLFTLVIACSNSMTQFLIARFLQGTGLCFIIVIGYATIQEIFEEMDAIRLIAIMANAAILAPLLGPLLGAIIINYTSWRVIFVSIAFCALLALWGLWKFMPEPIGSKTKAGGIIPRTPYTFRSMLANYKALCLNPAFSFSALATAFLTIPCVAWIALSPIIFISEAKLSVIEYGLWQLPIFASTILGNWLLHRLTYKYKVKDLICLGSVVLVLGVLFMALFPYFYGNNYYYLLPGIILYFFSLSIINAPLNRFSLYSTPVSKGTTSALISLTVMIIGAIGIEGANLFYQQHNNFYFGLYCTVVTAIFVLFILLSFYADKNDNPP
jgi:DHA1 family multidrug/chloramphenicol efflux transport protein-like MFS transporter